MQIDIDKQKPYSNLQIRFLLFIELLFAIQYLRQKVLVWIQQGLNLHQQVLVIFFHLLVNLIQGL